MKIWPAVPKGFSAREKQLIRQRLVDQGREAFAMYGLKRTSVEDLTRAVGISKGAFYLFFASKEELFVEVLARFEAELHARLLDVALRPGLTPRESFGVLVTEATSVRRTDPFLRHLTPEDVEQLFRRLPEERVAAMRDADVPFLAAFVERWRERGVAIGVEPRVLAGLLQTLFYASLHQDEVDQEVFPRVMDLLVDSLSRHVVAE
jgi:AcrR family transcriptional regulator